MRLPRLPSRRRTKQELRRFAFNTKLKALYLPGVPMTLLYVAMKKVAPTYAGAMQRLLPRYAARSVLAMNGVRVCIQGIENLKGLKEGPLVFFANHNSRMDSYILLAHLPFSFRSFWSNEAHTFKDGLKAIQWFGRQLDLFFFHDKFDLMVTVSEFKRAKAFLLEGGALGFFPEGRMHTDRRVLMEEFGDSCMSLAIETGATVLPIILTDTEYAYERPRRGAKPPVTLSFCKPFSTAHRRKSEACALNREVRAAMLAEYDALLGPEAVAARVRAPLPHDSFPEIHGGGP